MIVRVGLQHAEMRLQSHRLEGTGPDSHGLALALAGDDRGAARAQERQQELVRRRQLDDDGGVGPGAHRADLAEQRRIQRALAGRSEPIQRIDDIRCGQLSPVMEDDALA
ncbi:hypothetical protein PA598K_01919 [Paenibacillus sp. 598K]|nr:hypothetical protein PA598K_01919 [Paenibacillus sp. 598K]